MNFGIPNWKQLTAVILEVYTISSLIFPCIKQGKRGPGSSVGIATDYRLDGLGSNPGGD